MDANDRLRRNTGVSRTRRSSRSGMVTRLRRRRNARIESSSAATYGTSRAASGRSASSESSAARTPFPGAILSATCSILARVASSALLPWASSESTGVVSSSSASSLRW